MGGSDTLLIAYNQFLVYLDRTEQTTDLVKGVAVNYIRPFQLIGTGAAACKAVTPYMHVDEVLGVHIGLARHAKQPRDHVSHRYAAS